MTPTQTIFIASTHVICILATVLLIDVFPPIVAPTEDFTTSEAARVEFPDKIDPYQWGTVEYYELQAAMLYLGSSTATLNPEVHSDAVTRFPHLHPHEITPDAKMLAAGIGSLRKDVLHDKELRDLLPKSLADSIGGMRPDIMAFGLASLRHMMSVDDELNFQLPEKLRLSMKAKGYTYESQCIYSYYCAHHDVAWHLGGYDYESYMRHHKLDVSEICNEANKKLVGNFPWLEGDATWLWFTEVCTNFHHSKVLTAAIMSYLPGAVSDRCRGMIEAGWAVSDNGKFYNPDLSPSEMVNELAHSGVSPEIYDRVALTDDDWLPEFKTECLSRGFPPDEPFMSIGKHIVDSKDSTH